MSSLQDYYYAQLDDWEARFAALDAAHDVVQPDPVHEALTARFDRYARLRKSPLDARTRPPWWRSAHPLGLMLLSGNTCIPIPFRSITGQQVGRAPDSLSPPGERAPWLALDPTVAYPLGPTHPSNPTCVGRGCESGYPRAVRLSTVRDGGDQDERAV
jgi:hypothetical protein